MTRGPIRWRPYCWPLVKDCSAPLLLSGAVLSWLTKVTPVFGSLYVEGPRAARAAEMTPRCLDGCSLTSSPPEWRFPRCSSWASAGRRDRSSVPAAGRWWRLWAASATTTAKLWRRWSDVAATTRTRRATCMSTVCRSWRRRSLGCSRTLPSSTTVPLGQPRHHLAVVVRPSGRWKCPRRHWCLVRLTSKHRRKKTFQKL